MSAPEAELEEWRAAIARFLDKVASVGTGTSDLGKRGHDGIWDAMIELQLPSAAVPESHGGLGLGLRGIVTVCRELGRHLVDAPFLSGAAMAVRLLEASGDDDACAEYLPGLAAGSLKATVSFGEVTLDGVATDVSVRSVSDGECELVGRDEIVLDGDRAGLLLVAARDGSGVTLAAVWADALGVTITPLPTLDQRRRLSRVVLDGAAGTVIGRRGEGSDAVAAMLSTAWVALAAEQLGASERCLELTVEYLRNRTQFSRPIGSFQAVQHKCADLYVLLERMRSLIDRAVEGEDDELGHLARVARIVASEGAVRIAATALHLHGAIGFTWEHTSHLFLKRASSDRLLFGTPEMLTAGIAKDLDRILFASQSR